MKKWVKIQGKCIVIIFSIILTAAPFMVWKIDQVKKRYTDLHDRVNNIERVINAHINQLD